MKRKNVAIVTGLIITLVGANIQGTFGREESKSAEQGVHSEYQTDSAGTETAKPEAGESGSGTGMTKPNAGGSGSNTGTPKPEAGGSGSDTGMLKPDAGGSDTGTTKPDAGGSGSDTGTPKPDAGGSGSDTGTPKPDAGGSGSDTGTPKPDAGGSGSDTGTPKPDAGGSGSDTGTTKPDEGANGNATDNPEGELENNPSVDKDNDTQDQDTTQGQDAEDSQANQNSQANQDTQANENVQDNPAADSEEETQTAANNTIIKDNNPNAVYTGNIYKPSDTFIDNRDKVKYNAALPIDGIPSFITQEMIIGALKCQDETGFPASVTIAQIIQESGYGIYGPNGDKGQGLSYLAYQYNNLFGIKGTGPAGSVNMRTGEQTPSGDSYTTTAGFRVYNTYTECIEDRTKLLKDVYSDLTGGVTDANTFAMRIGSRWATDIRYAQSLIGVMERYDLYRLDRMTLGQFSKMIGTFANPCPGATLTSGFGHREFRNSFHKGIDLGTGASNLPIYAAAAGTVVTAGWSDTAGNWVVIDHGNGLVTKYMHQDKIYVKKGQKVEKGQQIGLSGNTGDSTGNHLHFQVEENGVAVDPAPYLGMDK